MMAPQIRSVKERVFDYYLLNVDTDEDGVLTDRKLTNENQILVGNGLLKDVLDVLHGTTRRLKHVAEEVPKELKKGSCSSSAPLKEHVWAWYHFSSNADSRRFLLEQDRTQDLGGQDQMHIMHPFRSSGEHKG